MNRDWKRAAVRRLNNAEAVKYTPPIDRNTSLAGPKIRLTPDEKLARNIRAKANRISRSKRPALKFCDGCDVVMDKNAYTWHIKRGECTGRKA